MVRLSGARLIVERASTTAAAITVDEVTLRQLAEAAGADIDAPFDCGRETPELGDPDEPLALAHPTALSYGGWFALGALVLDEVLVAVPGASRVQLWPEHFDLGCDLPVGACEGDRCNVGASPGDALEPEPYLYVGPWRPDRPGDGSYWNAAFGAVLRAADLTAAADPVAAGADFVRRGLAALRDG